MPAKRRNSSPGNQLAARNTRPRLETLQIPQDETSDYTVHSEVFGDFLIKVKLRSLSKAARNDPKPDFFEQLISGSLTDLLEPEGSPDNDLTESMHDEPSSNFANLSTRSTQSSKITQKYDEDDYDGEPSHYDENNDDDDKDHSDEEDYDDAEEDNTDDQEELDGSIHSEDDEHYEFSWMEPIDIEVVFMPNLDERTTRKKIAYCQAKLVRRNEIRYNFYEEMEAPSEDTSMLAFDLHDRYGRLRPEFRTHPYIRGTGVWGNELNDGDLLVIEELFVYEEYRRQQLGRKMIEALLKATQQKTTSFFAFVFPSFLNMQDLEQECQRLDNNKARIEMKHHKRDEAIAFFRSLAFRRVGSSFWFAFTPDDQHRSRGLATTEDYNPSGRSTDVLHPLLQPFQQIMDPVPSPLEEMLALETRKEPDYLQCLHACMKELGIADACWTGTDGYGNTVLHLSAVLLHVPCITWILNQEFGPQLQSSRNHRGETPLELLQFNLEKVRTLQRINALTVSTSDKFRGYHNTAVQCLLALKGLGSAESFRASNGSVALQRMAGGCTCGQCLSGFLSPRMSHILRFQASILYDILISNIAQQKGTDWVQDAEDYLRYVPSRVRNNLKTNKSMRQGFTKLCEHVANCLEQGMTPTTNNVLDIAYEAGEWPPNTRNYLQRGGTVESVFLAICRQAMEDSEPTGAGFYDEISKDEIANLPLCRNDHEYGYVSGMCGYRPISLVCHVDMRGHTLDEYGMIVDTQL